MNNLRERLLVVFVLGCFFLMLASKTSAQDSSADISGSVVDAQGAAIAGVKMSIIDVDKNIKRETTSNSDGAFSLPSLNPGHYRATAQKDGFQVSEITDIVLNVGDHRVLRIQMKVGSVSTSVTVSGNASTINTTDATVGTVIDREFAANMPLNGRSFQALISLTPGIVTTTANSATPGQFSINGQRQDSNYFTVDGVSANVGVASGGSILAGAGGSNVQPSASGGYSNLVSVDAMQEFKVQTSTFAPEYGVTPGGHISIVTRSGTNHFHGDAFDYLRNNDFDANDWILNSRAAAHPAEHQNDFGGVVGGPIWHDKAFFFGSYEGLRLSVPGQINLNVPSTCARGQGGCLTTGTNNSPAPVAIQPYLAGFPEPTIAACVGVLNVTSDGALDPFCASYPNKTTLDAFSFRGDYNLNSKMTLFGRWSYAPSQTSPRSTGTGLFPSTYDTYQFTGGLIWTISPILVNDFRMNYTYAEGYAHSVNDAFDGAIPVPATTIFPSSVTLPNGIGPIGPNNSRFFFIITPGTQWRSGDETSNQAHLTDYVDNVSMSRGTHQLKFGVDFRRLTPVQARALYQYSVTIPTTAALEAGTYSTATVNTNALADIVFHQWGIYAQDAWKANQRLTITYGLRWDFNPAPGVSSGAPFVGFNQISVTNPANTDTEVRIGPPTYHNQYNAFAPRIGVAYQFSKDPRWGRVVRAGWGIFFDTTGDLVSQWQESSASFGGANTFTNGTFPLTLAQLAVPTNGSANNLPPFPVEQGPNPNLRLPYTYEWNVAVEQSLGSLQNLTVTYTGAAGRNLFVDEVFAAASASTPAGALSAANLPKGYVAFTNQGSSNYQALQGLYQRRLSKGLLAMASYTYSHSIDTGSYAGYTLPNPTVEPTSQERGASDFDIRQSFQTALSYNIPHPGTNRLVDAVLGHWGTDMIFRARTGLPINVVDNNAEWAAFYPNSAISVRLNVVAGQPFYLYGAACAALYNVRACPGGMALNPAAFTAPSVTPCPTAPTVGCATTQGTLGRNALRSYGFNEADLTFRREFPIHESLKLQFRADFFNILNHPAFGYGSLASSLNFTTSVTPKAAAPFVLGNPYLTNSGFGKTTTMLNTSLIPSSGGVPGFNSLYQIGAPRSIQFSLKLVF